MKATELEIWNNAQIWKHAQKAEVLSITYLGLREVSMIATSTQTFVAGGFLAHNSSLYEAAAIGIPTLVLNCPEYRRHVNHGLRFWDAVPGPQVDEPADLPERISLALTNPDHHQIIREQAVNAVYDGGVLDGRATERAVAALTELAETWNGS